MQPILRTTLLLAASLSTDPVAARAQAEADDLATAAQRQLEELALSRQIPGLAAAVLLGQDVVFETALGFADVERRRPMTPTTPMQIGSVTKSFVASAVMLAVEREALDLDTPLAERLDDLPPSWSAITVRHLLGHTSGIPDYTTFPDILARYQLELPHEQILAEMTSHELQFAPGSRHAYSNSGYHFLGLALEQAADEPLGRILDEWIFDPAGMATARLLTTGAGCEPCAVGYVLDEGGQLVPGPHNSSSWSYAAGAVVASARDLSAWLVALQAGEPMSPELLEQMWTPIQVDSGDPVAYGLGYQLQPGPGVAYHTGSRPGFHATLGLLIEQELGIIVLINRSDVDSFPIAQRLAYLYRSATR